MQNDRRRKPPKLCRRKDDGRLYYTDPRTGRQVTVRDEAEYERFRAEFLASADQPRPCPPRATIAQLLDAYLDYADRRYRKRGRPTSYLGVAKVAARAVLACWGGGRDAGSIRGPDVAALQRHLIGLDLARTTINALVQLVRRVWRWGVFQDAVDPRALELMRSAPGLHRGEGGRETPRVRVADPAHVEAVLRLARAPVPDMIRLQQLGGCRPGEICALRPCDVDRTGAVWAYTVDPDYDKTVHKRAEGTARRVYFGPKAQAVLGPLLEAAKGRPGERLFRARQGLPMTVNAYGKRVELACERAGVPKWSPNRLRHSRATEIRQSRYGLEGAAAFLGHDDPDTTLLYAERDSELARRIASEMG